jgi:hypothetical protein
MNEVILPKRNALRIVEFQNQRRVRFQEPNKARMGAGKPKSGQAMASTHCPSHNGGNSPDPSM